MSNNSKVWSLVLHGQLFFHLQYQHTQINYVLIARFSCVGSWSWNVTKTWFRTVWTWLWYPYALKWQWLCFNCTILWHSVFVLAHFDLVQYITSNWDGPQSVWYLLHTFLATSFMIFYLCVHTCSAFQWKNTFLSPVSFLEQDNGLKSSWHSIIKCLLWMFFKQLVIMWYSCKFANGIQEKVYDWLVAVSFKWPLLKVDGSWLCLLNSVQIKH